jgi:cytochrome c-type biogenesis protein CcmH/NrfG
MNPALLRARQLLALNRPDHAEREVRSALSQNPEDHESLALLAVCLLEQNKLDDARGAAAEAVRRGPDDPFTHLILGRIAFKQDDHALARRAAAEATRLDPADSSPHGLLAAIELDEKRPAEALAAADRGLALDPDDEQCLNLRAMAQVKLNRRGDAAATVDGVLQKNPHNPVSHANAGWTSLHQGEVDQALEHFRESLRIDPTSQWARAGMLEALRARYVVYRVVLGFQLWLNRRTKRGQWVVVVGGYIGYQIVRRTAANNPELAPYLWPLVGLYLLFVILTWVGQPIFNIVLRFNTFGRAILSPGERFGSTVVGLVLLLAVGLGVGWLLTDDPVLLAGGLQSLLLVLPTAAITTARTPRERWIRGGWLLVMVLLSIACVVGLLLENEDIAMPALWLSLIAFIGFQLFVLARAIHGRASG